MFDTTITVFNYHEKTALWYPTIIPAVDCNAIQSKNSTTTAGITNSDTSELLIQSSPDRTVTCFGNYYVVSSQDNHILVGDGEKLIYSQRRKDCKKQFVTPKEYQTADNPDSLITFTPERDFIYIGEWDDTVPISDNISFDSGLYQYLNDLYDGVIKISSSSFFSLIPHFEIEGR